MEKTGPWGHSPSPPSCHVSALSGSSLQSPSEDIPPSIPTVQAHALEGKIREQGHRCRGRCRRPAGQGPDDGGWQAEVGEELSLPAGLRAMGLLEAVTVLSPQPVKPVERLAVLQALPVRLTVRFPPVGAGHQADGGHAMAEVVPWATWSPDPQPGSATHCPWGSVTSFLWLHFLFIHWKRFLRPSEGRWHGERLPRVPGLRTSPS